MMDSNRSGGRSALASEHGKEDNPNTVRPPRQISAWALEARRLYLWGAVDDPSAQRIVEGMHFLSAQSDQDIQFHIHSPGGATHSGMAILDTMQTLDCDVRTICLGLAASFGALLLMSGTPGKRHCLKNSKIMIHQPHVTGQYQSVATDLRIFADSVTRERDEIDRMIARCTGQSLEAVQKDTDRDRWIYADEAVEYGIVDSVLEANTGSGAAVEAAQLDRSGAMVI